MSKFREFNNSRILMIAGFYAIANVVEFCFSPDSFNPRIIYDVSKMRQHLIECLENGKMSAFPKEKEKSRGKLFIHLQKA